MKGGLKDSDGERTWDQGKAGQYQEPLMEESDKAYVASGGIIMSVSQKNLKVPIQEEAVHLLSGDPDVNR